MLQTWKADDYVRKLPAFIESYYLVHGILLLYPRIITLISEAVCPLRFSN
jgi:hypothetical protein